MHPHLGDATGSHYLSEVMPRRSRLGRNGLLDGLALDRGVVEHGLERELAAVVDLRDAHEDLLADAEDVLDVLHALAAGELAHLGDVQQAVL
ncbi:hypothetical protein ABE10_12655, partial [Bacillus toyonensis]|nr:hypothetical protein [Bacillus toyonensis]